MEYRLAPESKFPSFADDFASAYVSLMDATLAQEFGYSTERVSIMGVSAGALVVAHAALRLDAKYKPSMALLQLVLTRRSMDTTVRKHLFCTSAQETLETHETFSEALRYPMVDPEMRSKSHALYGRLPACPSRPLQKCGKGRLGHGYIPYQSQDRNFIFVDVLQCGALL